MIALQRRAVAKCGGPESTLRDRSGLESAISRCHFFAQFEDADIARQAAALDAGISQAQAFVDGNKRTALAALSTFLMLNGLFLVAKQYHQAKWLELVARSSHQRVRAEDAFAKWIRKKQVPLDEWLRENAATFGIPGTDR